MKAKSRVILLIPVMLSVFYGQAAAQRIPATSQEYVVFAWNDLGMHCINPTYDTAVILPPYNNLMAVVVRRAPKPVVVTKGVTVSYRMMGNTYSYGKEKFGQFWDLAQKTFGVALAKDVGLKGKKLSGSMDANGAVFSAVGIPVVPVNDDKSWQPYQVAEITVKGAGGKPLARTRATVPVSDEINCAKCHSGDPFAQILSLHDAAMGTSLTSATPVLCAGCHSSPALGTPLTKGVPYLSQAIHGFHADKMDPTGNPISCFDCHPGEKTKCNRSLRHTSTDGNCTSCHGPMAAVASSVAEGRVPWVSEPACGSCHVSAAHQTLTVTDPKAVSTIPQVDTGDALFRNAFGHGGIACAACHGSPHAMVPSREDKDNYQAVSYQGRARTIGSCAACHRSSGGEEGESGGFFEQHAGSGAVTASACNVCHTVVPSTKVSKYPHQLSWRSR